MLSLCFSLCFSVSFCLIFLWKKRQKWLTHCRTTGVLIKMWGESKLGNTVDVGF
jgi:hypothetical protein